MLRPGYSDLGGWQGDMRSRWACFDNIGDGRCHPAYIAIHEVDGISTAQTTPDLTYFLSNVSTFQIQANLGKS